MTLLHLATIFVRKIKIFCRIRRRYLFPCPIEDVTIASSPLWYYDIVTKNRYSDPETEKSKESRKSVSGADECRSRTLTPARRYRLSASAGVAWSMTRAIEMTFCRNVVLFARVSNFFSRSLVGHFGKLE